MLKKITAILFLLILFIGKSVSAQITIAPIMLFLDEENRFGTLLVLNGSDQVQEVSIEFPFGYPTTNEEGNISMVYDDSAAAKKYGISDAVRGFPRNFTLQPGQRQVVRMTVRPKDFQDGTYWSRIKTTSTPRAPAVGEASDEAITTQITYKFEQVTTVFYKHGEVSTGLKVNEFIAERNEDSIEVIADLSREGNSPFLGSIILRIKNEAGEVVIERRSSTSIYFDYRQVFVINRDQLSSGTYTADLQIISERNDVPKVDIVQIEPITKSINFNLK